MKQKVKGQNNVNFGKANHHGREKGSEGDLATQFVHLINSQLKGNINYIK